MPRTNPLIQYKRDDNYDNHGNNQLVYYNGNRYERRLSVESARTLSDSSTDTEALHHKEGKRRKNRSTMEQCEKEIQRLQSSVDLLRQKLEESELREANDSLEAITHQGDNKIRSIISRLLSMEEELRREQYKMSLILTHKQRVIEAQGQQIAELDRANNRLLSELSSLRSRYEVKNEKRAIMTSQDNDETTNF
jgi:RAS protein activator-like 2